MNKRQGQLAKVGKYPFKKRIQIWNAGYEFARYIHGGLIQFKKLKPHGYPDSAGSYENWMKIIDEMIWTFREISMEYPGDPISIAFDKMYDRHPEALHFHFKKVIEEDGNILYEMVDGHPEYSAKEVYTEKNIADQKAYQKRIEEGLSLFARYLPHLWD